MKRGGYSPRQEARQPSDAFFLLPLTTNINKWQMSYVLNGHKMSVSPRCHSREKIIALVCLLGWRQAGLSGEQYSGSWAWYGETGTSPTPTIDKYKIHHALFLILNIILFSLKSSKKRKSTDGIGMITPAAYWCLLVSVENNTWDESKIRLLETGWQFHPKCIIKGNQFRIKDGAVKSFFVPRWTEEDPVGSRGDGQELLNTHIVPL